MNRLRLAGRAGVLLAVVLGAGGCGSGEAEQQAVDSLAQVMSSGINDDNSRIFGPDFPACFAAALVDEAGLDRLVEDGVVAEDGTATSDLNSSRVSEETAEAYADAEYACIEWDQMADYLLRSGDLSPARPAQVEAYVSCLSEIDADAWRANSRDQGLSEVHTDAVTAFKESVSDCRDGADLP